MTSFRVLLTVALLAGCGQSHLSGGDGGMSGVDLGTDATACAGPSECRVLPQSCCGSCGAAVRGDALAIHEDDVDAHRSMVCDALVCPPCFTPEDPTLVGACVASACTLVDLQQRDDITACTTDDECRVRTSDCCECGGTTDPDAAIAVRVDAEQPLSALICDADVGCPECLPAPPPGLIAACISGRCELQRPFPLP